MLEDCGHFVTSTLCTFDVIGHNCNMYVNKVGYANSCSIVVKSVFRFTEVSWVPKRSPWAMFLLSGGAVIGASITSLLYITDSRL